MLDAMSSISGFINRVPILSARRRASGKNLTRRAKTFSTMFPISCFASAYSAFDSSLFGDFFEPFAEGFGEDFEGVLPFLRVCHPFNAASRRCSSFARRVAHPFFAALLRLDAMYYT